MLYEVITIRLGVLAHDMDDLWSGTRKEGGVDLNTEIIFSRPSFSLLSGDIRPNLGASINTQGDTSKVYGGILWEFETKSGIFLNLGIGAAIHDGKTDTDREDKKSLGSVITSYSIHYTKLYDPKKTARNYFS